MGANRVVARVAWCAAGARSAGTKGLVEAGAEVRALALPFSQWKSSSTINALERVNAEVRFRIRVRWRPRRAGVVRMLFWALPVTGQSMLCQIGARQSLQEPPARIELDAAA